MLLMKADANRNAITEMLSCLLSHFRTLSISRLASLFNSETVITYYLLTRAMNLKIKEFYCDSWLIANSGEKRASGQFSRKMMQT